MVSGTKWGSGDPFLTKQNEPSVAVSSLNPQHLLAGSNDYRLIDFTNFNEIPGDTSSPDAWVSVYKSLDGGVNWKSQVLGGCAQNIPECNSPLSSAIKGLQFAADPTVRSGPYGTFFYSFIAGNRGTSANSVIAIQRFVDKNDKLDVAGDPFQTDVLNVIDTGTTGQFKDKSWNAADIPGRPWNGTATCTLPNYASPVPAFNVYISYSNFTGQSNSNSHPQVLVARSTDCGKTFQKAVKVSNSVNTSSGSTLAIDPQTGYVYVAWRYFGSSASDPSAIFVSVSTDGGSRFSNPIQVAVFTPFDQGTSAVSFRTNALPTIAASVKGGVSRVHIAWAQRSGPNGDARIAMSTSSDGSGKTWGPPVAIDNWISDPANPVNPGRGHQVQPALVFGGGKLTAVWYDLRYDSTVGVMTCPVGVNCDTAKKFVETRRPVGNLADSPPGLSTVFTTFLTDGTPGLKKRHTMDVFTAMADPDSPCLVSGACQAFVSSRVSQYAMGNKKLPSQGSARVQQLGFNVPNLPIFVKGTASFLGDYIDVATRTFLPTGNASAPFRYNTDPSDRSAFHAVWTDNRDVVPPPNGNWASYTPLSQIVSTTSGGVTTTTTATNANCQNPAARNQNVYSARISEGTEVAVSANVKTINTGIARGFVVTVKNSDNVARTYALTINPAAGVRASFEQDLTQTLVTTLNLTVPPSSSASRTVWASSTLGATPQLTVTIADGAKTFTVALNPDPLSAPIPNVDLTNVDLTNVDLTNISVKAVDLTNVDLTNVDLTNVDLTNVDLTNSAFRNVDLTNVDLTNVDLTNVDLTNVSTTNVDLTNVDLTNVAITNVDLTNVDLTNVDLTNVDLTNTSYSNVDLTNVDLTNVDLTNSTMNDASFTLVNRSNTDVAVNVKSLLRGSTVPNGYKLQLVLRKVSLNATAKACKIVFTQQSTQDAVVAPKPSDPTSGTLGSFDAVNGDVSNATMPLAANEQAYITMRIVAPKDPSGVDMAKEFGQNALKFVAAGPAGSRTPVPLIIQTLALGSATALTTSVVPMRTFGGTGSVTWNMTLADGTPAPSWLTIASVPPPANDKTYTGRLTITNPIPGTYRLRFNVNDDQSLPIQTDSQVLTLIVNPAAQTTISFASGAPLPTSLNVGGTTTGILALGSSGLPATITVSGPCTLTGTPAGGYTLTAIGVGSCVLTATQDGLVSGVQIYASISVSAPPIPIVKANQTITFNALSARTFGDAPFALVATASSNLPVSFSASGNCSTAGGTVTITGAGSCSITASQSGDSNFNPALNVTQPFTIAQAAATLVVDPASISQTYDGSVKSITVTTTPAGLTGVSVSYTGARQDAGSYPFTATLTNANYAAAPAAGTLVINKAPSTATLGNLSQTYTGAGLSASVTTAPANLGVSVTYNAAAALPVNAGSYAVVATVTDPNYVGTVSGTLVINKATATVTLGDLSQTYTGAGLAATAVTAPLGLNVTFTYNGSTTLPIAVGNYAVVATVNDANYVGTASGTLAINKATATVTLGGLSQTYTGAGLAATAVTAPASLNLTFTYNGSSTLPVAAGNYAVLATVNNPNYVGSASGTLAINKATATLAVSNLSQTYDTTVKAVTVTTSPANLTGFTVSYTGNRQDAGSYPFTASLNNANYAAAPVSGTLVITPAAAVVSLGGLSQTFDGTPKPVTVTTVPAGLTFAVTYNGSATVPSAAGSYAVLATVTNPNYAGSATGTLLIRQDKIDATGNMAQARSQHTATLLNDGRVLLTGGLDATGSSTATAELYNPATGTFQAVGNMPSKSVGHAAALLNDGRVLVTGGGNSSSEIYNPSTRTFTAGGGLSSNRSYHTATTLSNGRVLIAGGAASNSTLASTILYDPATGAFSAGPNMIASRERHTATVSNGKVLFAGGRTKQGSGYVTVSSLEVYDPATNSFTAAGALAAGRYSHAAIVSGTSLIFAGGSNGTTDLNTAEFFTIAANGSLTPAGTVTMQAGRSALAGALISGGRVLLTGGQSSGAVLSSTEIFTSVFAFGPPMNATVLIPRANHTATALQDGRVLITGGNGTNGTALNSADLFASIP